MKTTTRKAADIHTTTTRCAKLRNMIRATEAEVLYLAEGSDARANAQGRLDFQVAQLARYGGE